MPSSVVLAVIWREGRIFLQRRALTAEVMPGQWELPGGKREGAESLEEALVRELGEELDWRPVALRLLGHFPGQGLNLAAFLAEGEGPLRTGLAWGWFTPEETLDLPVISATKPIVARFFGNLSSEGLVPARMKPGNTTRECP